MGGGVIVVLFSMVSKAMFSMGSFSCSDPDCGT